MGLVERDESRKLRKQGLISGRSRELSSLAGVIEGAEPLNAAPALHDLTRMYLKKEKPP